MVKILFDVHRWETEDAFESLLEYINISEWQFGKIRDAARKRIPEKPSGSTDEDFQEWQTKLHFYEERYKKEFPSNIRYSFILLIWILIETRLKAVCDEISLRKGLSMRENELRGAPIVRASIFLRKVAQIHLENTTLQELSDLNKVRDCIVHMNGQVDLSRDKKRLIELTQRNIGILRIEGKLVIDRDYCTRSLSTARRFFEELFDAAGFGPSIPTVE